MVENEIIELYREKTRVEAEIHQLRQQTSLGTVDDNRIDELFRKYNNIRHRLESLGEKAV